MTRSNRRSFIKSIGATAIGGSLAQPFLASSQSFSPASSQKTLVTPASEREWDLVIIGGGVGGIAAALSACRRGLRVGLTEENDWIGGQLSSQAVPPDENPWIEKGGCTAMYSEYRTRVREYYKRHFKLTDAAAKDPMLNPGGGWVSRLCHEPRAAWMTLLEMAAPYLHSGRLQIFTRTRAVQAWARADRVEAVEVEMQLDNRREIWTAPYFIDATELGDLLPISGAEYRYGSESIHETGEPHVRCTICGMRMSLLNFVSHHLVCHSREEEEAEDEDEATVADGASTSLSAIHMQLHVDESCGQKTMILMMPDAWFHEEFETPPRSPLPSREHVLASVDDLGNYDQDDMCPVCLCNLKELEDILDQGQELNA